MHKEVSTSAVIATGFIVENHYLIKCSYINEKYEANRCLKIQERVLAD